MIDCMDGTLSAIGKLVGEIEIDSGFARCAAENPDLLIVLSQFQLYATGVLLSGRAEMQNEVSQLVNDDSRSPRDKLQRVLDAVLRYGDAPSNAVN